MARRRRQLAATIPKLALKTDRLSALPVELRLKIYSYLPPRELYCLRILSKSTKALIETNQDALLRPKMFHHKARIKSCHKQLLRASELSFKEAISGFLSHYGDLKDTNARADALLRFCATYIKKRYPNDPVYNDRRSALQGCAMAVLVPDYFKFPNDRAKKRFLKHYEHKIDRIALQTSDGHLFSLIQQLQSLAQPSISQSMPDLGGFPRFYLTQGIKYSVVPTTVYYSRCTSLFENITYVLGIPPLGRHGLFAYCVKSHRMWALANEAWMKRGTKLSAFEKAALLEEIFIW